MGIWVIYFSQVIFCFYWWNQSQPSNNPPPFLPNPCESRGGTSADEVHISVSGHYHPPPQPLPTRKGGGKVPTCFLNQLACIYILYRGS